LIELKGFHFAIEALVMLPEFDLVIAGDGPKERALRQLAVSLGVDDRVRFLGHVDQTLLRDYFAAADAFVLMSSREGIANVIMESMASGTPVLATAVWGAPEILRVPEAGRLIKERSAEALAKEVRALTQSLPDRRATRRYAEQFTWAQTTQDHLAVYESVLGKQLR
jgi:glycosyltransferase involved in cell wall biosynthesis